ncbi:glucoamylase family protein [Flagellimonas sp.]|uniref:glucoamylase family protein n=1 Tax=Flagellimonas sp. TaxID=2058762 RepID=UPI003B50D1FD
MRGKSTSFVLFIILLFVACGKDDYTYTPTPFPEDDSITPPEPVITDMELLDLTQRETFKYFWDFAEVNSGGARERYHPNDPERDAHVVTSGGTGFGLMAILVGIERGYVTREQGVQRIATLLDFLENADRFHGAWSHWINGNNGSVIPFSPSDNGGDLVETAFLVQGLICIKEYFKNGSENEKTLAEQADNLWKGVEWDWYTQNKNALYWHWSPNFGFDINLELKGYNEVLITYVLAAASPDYGIVKEVYTNGWASNGSITSSNTQYGFPLLVRHPGAQQYGGPLFWAHYSYLGLNPKGLSDEYVNYWNVISNHTNINYEYCVENPKNFEDYGPNCWGLTASYSRNNDGTLGYNAHHPANDTGVVSPTASISSIPYTPNKSLRAIHYFYRNKNKLLGPAGFYDAFSPEHGFWVAEAYLAIDQGPQIIMIENHRTGLLWNLFMQNEEVRAGLDKLGFSYQF